MSRQQRLQKTAIRRGLGDRQLTKDAVSPTFCFCLTRRWRELNIFLCWQMCRLSEHLPPRMAIKPRYPWVAERVVSLGRSGCSALCGCRLAERSACCQGLDVVVAFRVQLRSMMIAVSSTSLRTRHLVELVDLHLRAHHVERVVVLH